MKNGSHSHPCYLYTNFSRDTVCFRDLLEYPRVFGSNETEEVLHDLGDMRSAEAICKAGCKEVAPIGENGMRFYY